MIVRKNSMIRLVTLLLALMFLTPFSTSVMAEAVFKTTAEATSATTSLGFQKTSDIVNLKLYIRKVVSTLVEM